MTTATADVVVSSSDEAVTKMATWLKKKLSSEERHMLTHGTQGDLETMAESIYRDYADTRPIELSKIINSGIRSNSERTLCSAFREALRKLKTELTTPPAKKGRAA